MRRDAAHGALWHTADVEQDEEPPNRRGALIALVAVVLLVLAGMYLTGVLRHTSSIQDCVMSGRTNCAPIRTGGG